MTTAVCGNCVKLFLNWMGFLDCRDGEGAHEHTMEAGCSGFTLKMKEEENDPRI
jgi:hypothetical protein